jgi:hypothetical protein
MSTRIFNWKRKCAYDFARNFTTTFSDGVSTRFVTTNLRPLTTLFGPKLQAGTSGPFRAYVTRKVGFVNFSTSSRDALPGFTSSLGAVTTGNTQFALYPGGGIEGFWGPIEMRLEVGDEIYFDNGAQNNLRVTFGPTLRFEVFPGFAVAVSAHRLRSSTPPPAATLVVPSGESRT